MPDSTCRAQRFVVRVMDPDPGFLDVSAGVRATATLQERGEYQDKLREENQQ